MSACRVGIEWPCLYDIRYQSCLVQFFNQNRQNNWFKKSHLSRRRIESMFVLPKFPLWFYFAKSPRILLKFRHMPPQFVAKIKQFASDLLLCSHVKKSHKPDVFLYQKSIFSISSIFYLDILSYTVQWINVDTLYWIPMIRQWVLSFLLAN